MNKTKALDWEKTEERLGLHQKMWLDRVEVMVKFIDDTDRKVMDLGAGSMHLKELLSKDVEYYPVDYVKRSSETIVCDFNKNEFPEFDVDVMVCSGILEYIEQPKQFLDNVTKHCRKIILSYKGKEKFDYTMLFSNEIIDFLLLKGFRMTKENKQYSDLWTILSCFERVEK